MLGAGPQIRTDDRVARDTPAALAHRMAAVMTRPTPQATTPRRRGGAPVIRWLVLGAIALSPAALLIQGTSLPESSAQAIERSGVSTVVRTPPAETPAPMRISFDERFGGESAVSLRPPDTTASVSPRPARVASLVQPKAIIRTALAESRTELVRLQSAAFPYLGDNPRTDQPFLNVSEHGRRGHRGPTGRIYWQNETYNDNRVLVHIPRGFDIRKPGVIVVFFHGNGATLERDVRDRQLVPKQISDSGANAVLLAPQLAVDAIDSSAGKFWQPGGLKRFLDESAAQLARMTGNPHAAKAFADMPVVIVGYSGGFVPAAYSLAVGGVEKRIRGVFLLDALYGELDKFAAFIERNPSAFFVSAYTPSTRHHDAELISMLEQRGIRITRDLDKPLKPGTVAFIATGEGIRHRDYVTQAWTAYPVKEVLVKMAQARR
jgi:hypothetical protein